MLTFRLLVLSASALLLLAVPGQVNGQRRLDVRVGLSDLAAERLRPVSASTLRLEPERSYWKEGGALTALAVVVAINLMAYDSSIGERIGGSLLSIPVFFVPGALIGSLIPKK